MAQVDLAHPALVHTQQAQIILGQVTILTPGLHPGLCPLPLLPLHQTIIGWLPDNLLLAQPIIDRRQEISELCPEIGFTQNLLVAHLGLKKGGDLKPNRGALVVVPDRTASQLQRELSKKMHLWSVPISIIHKLKKFALFAKLVFIQRQFVLRHLPTTQLIRTMGREHLAMIENPTMLPGPHFLV